MNSTCADRANPGDDLGFRLRRAARRHCLRTAISHNGRPLTYAELDLAVDQLAARLGPQPGVVGVRTSRAPATIVHLLGVLAAGGTYCPIDPVYPPERRAALLHAVGAQIVLPLLPEITTPAVTTPAIPASIDAPAYILFTSGSTGVPKPVLTPRRAIGIVATALVELFRLTPLDRVLQFASLNWDTCFEEILPTLLAGATLVFNDEAYAGSFPRLLRMIAAEQITVLDLPTAFWHELVHYLVEDGIQLPDCLRLVIIGGEAVNAARLADWRALDTAAIRLLNTYGCTETTLITHAAELHGPLAPSTVDSGQAPIGWALPHVREQLSDDGELLVGGPALASGYLNRPDETAARFSSRNTDLTPFFGTGDRVARRADGALLHLGRLDHQLKVRGIRVDPGEVEAHIGGHPGVAASAVAGVTVADHTTLAAYVVPRSFVNASALGADVLDYLRARVPGHLVPNHITVVPDLVHTPSGKVDRAGSHRRHGVNHGSSQPRFKELS